MLADPRADALVHNFAEQWLGLRQLATINPTSTDYDGTLRESMQRETELLFSSILREDRSVLDLINADYTFVDERLARTLWHCAYPGQPVPPRAGQRRQSSWHPRAGQRVDTDVGAQPHIRRQAVASGYWKTCSAHRRRHPRRGVEVKLDQPTGTPGMRQPPCGSAWSSTRANPSCGACHGVIDPIGIALENFDAIGKWRDTTAGQPVDAVTALWDGTPLHGAADLRKALVARSPQFVETVTEKLLSTGSVARWSTMTCQRSVASSAMPGPGITSSGS